MYFSGYHLGHVPLAANLVGLEDIPGANSPGNGAGLESALPGHHCQQRELRRPLVRFQVHFFILERCLSLMSSKRL